MEADIKHIAESLQNTRGRDASCAILIGAGCSVSAGIPAANGIIELIKDKFPVKWGSVKEKTYTSCMTALSPAERRLVILDAIKDSKVNWAHICIAQLMKENHINRILSTNFDLLVERACSLLDMQPAVYDFAASQKYIPAHVSDNALFHLHGQRTGFTLLNTDEELGKHSTKVKPVIEDTLKNRVLIVVGYSGEVDPLFQHLANQAQFMEAVYWIGFKDNKPPEHVQNGLLTNNKGAFYVSGYDADSFFANLMRELGCPPPDFIQKPLQHMLNVFENITPYRMPGEDGGEIDLTENTKNLLKSLIKEEAKSSTAGEIERARELLLKSETEEILKNLPTYNGWEKGELGNIVAWAYITEGNVYSDKAWNKEGKEADRLYKLSYEKYEAALKIKFDSHEALYNWGTTLSNQTERKLEKDANKLFLLAYEKFEAALKIKPDKDQALYNWGIALSKQAKRKPESEADPLYELAYEKYEAALKIKPSTHDVLNSWGNGLSGQARRKPESEANSLYELAYDKYDAALKIKPESHETLNNWGLALWDQAGRKPESEADSLYGLAYEKFEAALKIKPDKYGVFNNWGMVLSEQTERKLEKDADKLFVFAFEKFEAALKIKPDTYEAFNNWGIALSKQAGRKPESVADSLYKLAYEKYKAALKIKPNGHDAFSNWGAALSGQADKKPDKEVDKLYKLAYKKYEAALKIKPDKHEALDGWSITLLKQAKRKPEDKRIDIFAQAEEKLRMAEDILEGSGSYNLACIASFRKKEEESRKWFNIAENTENLPSRKDLEEDSDLDNVRNLKWFKDILKKAKPA